LIFYNGKGPNKSLDLKSPLKYLVEKGIIPKMSLTYTGDLKNYQNKLW